MARSSSTPLPSTSPRAGRRQFPHCQVFIRTTGVLVACLALVASPLSAADPAPAAARAPVDAAPPKFELPTKYECRFTEGTFKIDGLADEPAWKHAQLIDSFGLPWLGEKARAAKTATRARLLWDREQLYFFAEMDDSDLYAEAKEPDGTLWNNDVFELFFKPALDKPGYYEFQVTPAGIKLDMFLPRRGAGGYERFKSTDEFDWKTAVKTTGTVNRWHDKDTGWSVEGAIPWTDFVKCGGRPYVGESWRFALCRYDYSVDFEGPELSTCAPLAGPSNPNFHRHEDYAELVFLGPDEKFGAKPRALPDWKPVTTSRVVGWPDPPLPYVTERAYPKLTLNCPIAVASEPGGQRVWMIDQPWPYAPSRLIRFEDRADVSSFEIILADDRTSYGIAFHPKFAENGYVYLGCNSRSPGPDTKKTTKVCRFETSRDGKCTVDLKSETVIIEWESDGHNGGDMAFGRDGMLYITSGDGTSDSDTNLTGQDLTKLLAKVLRIDVDHPAAGQHYSVPADNPFVNRPGTRPETWAYGFRNPWRITVDRETGHVWVGNNGQDLWEQAYFVERGANYGWSVMEGSYPFYLDRAKGPEPFAKPALEHPHSEARSLTGGIVYYGSKLPELRGAYIYGDYSTGKIWGAKHDGQRVVWHKLLADTPFAISGFGVDREGELLVADHKGNDEGAVYRLAPRPADAPRYDFPQTLSASGLFASVADHTLVPGAIPYSVNAPLWSDGAIKSRYIVLPPTMIEKGAEVPARIDFTATRGWKFPEGTVLVKSFALELVSGDPTSRKWIETRFLTKQEGEWVGYSYAWNDEQTDATLVDAAGRDQTFTIRSAVAKEGAGDQTGAADQAIAANKTPAPTVRQQVWHYPSRTECMVCHSRAQNFVLGTTLLQMNRDHDYGGIVDNQLRTLERLGVLRVNWQAEATAALRESLKAAGKKEGEAKTPVEARTATRLQRTSPLSQLLFKLPTAYEHLVDPYDPAADLAARARSYLHANCSQCHVQAGGGNAMMELEWTASLEKTRLIDVKPLHHTFDLADPRLVAPGAPERSVLLHRIALRGRGQMPQLATAIVDEQAVAMLKAWIAQLPPKAEEPKAAEQKAAEQKAAKSE